MSFLSFQTPLSRQYSKRYEQLLEREIVGHGESLLDVACGSSSPIRGFSAKIAKTVGVDGFLPSLEKSKAAGIHREYRQLNVLKVGEVFGDKAFDVVVGLDIIEHFSKEEGARLLAEMERVARKRVVIFTPNGFLPQEPYDGNEAQRHLSGWTVQEMRARGYRVYGVNGWKPLRGEFAKARFRPHRVWSRISDLTQPWVYARPERAFQILCVKDV